MNAPSPNEAPLDPDKEIRDVMISDLGLNAVDLDKIYDLMQSTDFTFSEAAQHLGLASSEQVTEARLRARGAAEGAGLIETAMLRISSDRRIVVKHGEPVNPGPQLILAHDPYNPRSEKIRALRTELLLLNEGGRRANIVPVVSPGPGEGRSQLSAELAISFAQLGRRTLLVDADLRKPQQHALFESENEYGLTRALSLRERPLFHPVVGLPVMHLLTAGPTAPNPLELLSDGRFEKLLGEWRNNYEFIVIDTPPVSQCADALAVASLAARVLLVSRSQRTSYKDMREMMRRLAPTQSTILGAVLNHF
jgi:receptor protein-tyrosine kinase